jgi:hypothetical protein
MVWRHHIAPTVQLTAALAVQLTAPAIHANSHNMQGGVLAAHQWACVTSLGPKTISRRDNAKRQQLPESDQQQLRVHSSQSPRSGQAH